MVFKNIMYICKCIFIRCMYYCIGMHNGTLQYRMVYKGINVYLMYDKGHSYDCCNVEVKG